MTDRQLQMTVEEEATRAETVLGFMATRPPTKTDMLRRELGKQGLRMAVRVQDPDFVRAVLGDRQQEEKP